MHVWPDEAPALRLSVPAGVTGVTAAQTAWQGLAKAHALAPRTVYRVELVLEELLMNVALHGHSDDAVHAVDVALTLADDAVHLMLSDDGVAFDPAGLPAAAPLAGIEHAAAGGRGLVLVRHAVRNWSTTRVDGRNVQRLVIARD